MSTFTARLADRAWTGSDGKNKILTILGVVAGLLGEIGGYAGLFPVDSRLHLVCAACALLGAALRWPASKGGPLTALLLLGISAAAPAHATGFGVMCLQGCPKEVPASRDRALVGAQGDIPVGSTVWIGPSVSLQLFQRDAQKKWSISGTPTLSWGVFWRPASWTATSSLASFNLGLGVGSTQVFSDQASTFDLNLVPTFGLADILQIGYGPSFHFATSAKQNDGVTGTLFIGIGTSFGGP